MLFSDIKDATSFPVPESGALVDLAYVVSHSHLESALYRVQFNREKRGSANMSASTISSNIYYALSSSKKMSETQKKYAPSATTTSAAYLLMDPSEESLATLRNTISEQALGVEVPDTNYVSSLMTAEKATELAAVFKLSPHELKIGSLEDAIIMKIAVKEIV